MPKVLTLPLRCSPKVLNEHLSQQQLFTRLTAKLLKVLMSLSSNINLLNMLMYPSDLSNLVQCRAATGSWLSCSMSILAEQVSVAGSFPGCSRCDREACGSRLVPGMWRGSQR